MKQIKQVARFQANAQNIKLLFISFRKNWLKFSQQVILSKNMKTDYNLEKIKENTLFHVLGFCPAVPGAPKGPVLVQKAPAQPWSNWVYNTPGIRLTFVASFGWIF